MYCQNCGKQIDENVSFCKHCGSAVPGNQQGGSAASWNQQDGSAASWNQQGGSIQNAGMQYTDQMQRQNQMPYQNIPYQNVPYQNGAGMSYPAQRAAEKINIFAIASSCLLAVAMFLPYVSIESFISVSKSLIEGDGVFFMIIAALGIIGALVRKNKIVILAGILACVLSVVEIAIFMNNEYSEFYTKGIGFYMMIIASVLLLISGFVKRK